MVSTLKLYKVSYCLASKVLGPQLRETKDMVTVLLPQIGEFEAVMG
jgi:hypothetical protein